MRFIFPFFLTVSITLAAPLERDLGQGLVYVRVHAVPGDLPAPAAHPQSTVLDLRYVAADAAAASALQAWVRFRATAHTPVFLLANGDTAPALLAPFADRDSVGAVMIVGIAAKDFRPDIAVPASPDTERRAYDALETGATLAMLLTDHPDKVRNDEASLAKDRLAEAAADAVQDAVKPHPAPPPIDATLQRAVHLHRALLALKKL
jgi:hypothetical protein